MLHSVEMFVTDVGVERAVLLPISGFCREIDENSHPLSYYEASSGNLLKTFRDNLSVPSALSWFITQRIAVFFLPTFGFLASEDGTAMLSRNLCKKFPLLAA